ncbi:sensor domain-containing diguanylate cyclase [Sulfurimonas sp.]|uniref:GGDEF domain-containing protein n=1 Tax=Sulfurimonas sp. TaxID=2022749 RepID=UPI0025E8F900|nr:sensor domain-containing diguanylate cyclase [Sulfurimonas sp.]MBW6488393.1 diguanylate cyclase [Sulfurimonas sp.]
MTSACRDFFSLKKVNLLVTVLVAVILSITLFYTYTVAKNYFKTQDIERIKGDVLELGQTLASSMQRADVDSALRIMNKRMTTHKEYETLSIALENKIVVSTDNKMVGGVYEEGLHADDISGCSVREDVVFYSDFSYFKNGKEATFNLIVDLNDEHLLSAEHDVQNLVVTFMLYFILIIVIFLILLYFLNIYPLIKLNRCILNHECKPSDFIIKEHSSIYRNIVEKYNEIAHLNKTLEEKVAQRTKMLSKTNELFKEAQKLTRIGNWEWNIGSNMIVWSDEVFTIFGHKPQEFTPTYDAFMNFVHPDDREFLKDAIEKALRSGKDYAVHHRIVLQDGTQKVVYEKGRMKYDEMHNPLRMLGTVHDITERYKINKELEFQSRLLNSVTDSIFVHDLDGNFIYVNEAAYATRGYTKEELLQMKVQDLEYHDEKSGDEVYEDNLANTKEQLSRKEKAVIEVSHKTKEGKIIPIEITCRFIQDEGKSYLISIARDISILKAMNENLKRMANTDSLTGIYNRHKFEDIYKAEVERVLRYKSPLSMIMVDIDYFKKVNDTYGHDVGDYVLKSMVEIVKKNIRNIDIFVRWGGEEFIILCPETDSLSAALLAEKLRGSIEETTLEKVGNITCSFGVASYVKKESEESFIKRLDSALYRAKDEGRNRVVVI